MVFPLIFISQRGEEIIFLKDYMILSETVVIGPARREGAGLKLPKILESFSRKRY